MYLTSSLLETNELFAMTTNIDKEFRTYSLQIWSRLKCEVEKSLDISDIAMELRTYFHLPMPAHITSIQDLNILFFSTLHVSWFNFEPIRFIATQ